MERLHEQAARSRLDVDPAEGSHVEAAGRLESMGHAAASRLRHELLLEPPEEIMVERLELEAGLVPQSPTTLDAVASLTAEPVGQETPSLGQGLRRAGRNLGEGQPVTTPTDQMACRRDGQRSGITAAFDRAVCADLEQLGMQVRP